MAVQGPAPNPAVLLGKVRRATKARDTAEEGWRRSIMAAVDAKIPVRTVAEAAGVSHPRIVQITALVRKYG